MNNQYFEKLKELNEINQDDKSNVEPAYPAIDGIVWPPRNLNDVTNNCAIWLDFGFFDRDDLPNSTVTNSTHKQKDAVTLSKLLKQIRM